MQCQRCGESSELTERERAGFPVAAFGFWISGVLLTGVCRRCRGVNRAGSRIAETREDCNSAG